jgi:hypothetical protein
MPYANFEFNFAAPVEPRRSVEEFLAGPAELVVDVVDG